MIVLVTGASSGIGYSSAINLAGKGHKVYAAARRMERMEPLREYGIVPVSLDVTSEESMQACIDGILAAEGRIDVLVNNAGYGYFGAVENVSMPEARRQLEVNVFGLARLTQLVLPSMRKQGFGRIVNVGSVAGRIVLPFGGWYHVSKYAVEALSDALRIEVKPFGIDVVLIEPGGIGTEWGNIAADHLEESCAGTPYAASAQKEARLMHFAYSGKYLSGPKVVSHAISRAVNARHPRHRYHPGSGSYFLLWLHALLPARWWDLLMRWAVKA
ncbi:MAG: SDR family NAD(P)-dependent oxidoreductase [Bacteroidales bacterium]|nr:SDR family NAD(P)-dependent oxidoreductase [Bacteroidales bacterium]